MRRVLSCPTFWGRRDFKPSASASDVSLLEQLANRTQEGAWAAVGPKGAGSELTTGRVCLCGRSLKPVVAEFNKISICFKLVTRSVWYRISPLLLEREAYRWKSPNDAQ